MTGRSLHRYSRSVSGNLIDVTGGVGTTAIILKNFPLRSLLILGQCTLHLPIARVVVSDTSFRQLSIASIEDAGMKITGQYV